MRVLLAGIFRPGHLGATYQRAFAALDHEVITFDLDTHRAKLDWWLRTKVGHRLTIGSYRARRAGSSGFNQALQAMVTRAQPDLVLAFNGEFLMPETVRKIRKCGTRFIIFHADNPLPPHYNSRPETLEAARECDAFLVWSSSLVKKLCELGIPAGFLAFGWDENVFPFQGFPEQKDYDVAFIGGWDRQREQFLEGVAKHFNLKIWGPSYWGERTQRQGKARGCWQGRAVSGVEASTIFSRTRINLNIFREQHYVNGVADGVIMRTFEVPGAGGFQLATRSVDAITLFPEGEAAGYFSNLDQCLEQIDYYLSRQKRRMEMTRNAHATVDVGHHYTNRVNDLLAFTN